MLSLITARCTIESISPMCQSRHHGEPELEGESPDAYDLRTWKLRMHTKFPLSLNSPQKAGEPNAESNTVTIPAKALHEALTEGAKYTKRQIPGQGKATWTAKFASGIALLSDIEIGVDPDTVPNIAVHCHSNGVRGSGKRVIRRFPIIQNWKATFDVQILDPIITKDIFMEMAEQAGMFIGVGQNRPQNRGVHGRFRVLSVAYEGAPQVDPRRVRAA